MLLWGLVYASCMLYFSLTAIESSLLFWGLAFKPRNEVTHIKEPVKC
jgi:hypothetical protein